MFRSLAVSDLENIKLSIHDVNNSKFIKYVFFDVKVFFDNVHTIFQVCHPKKNECKNDLPRLIFRTRNRDQYLKMVLFSVVFKVLKIKRLSNKLQISRDFVCCMGSILGSGVHDGKAQKSSLLCVPEKHSKQNCSSLSFQNP